MLIKNMCRVYLLLLLTSALAAISVPATHAECITSHRNALNQDLQLPDPTLFHQVIRFAPLAYEIDQEGNLPGNERNKYTGWHISAIEGKTGIKGANILKPAISTAANYFLASTAMDEVDLEEAEQSGLLALRPNSDNPYHITAVIAFNGTKSTPGVLTDINAAQKNLPLGLQGKGHRGFINAANSSYCSVKQTLIDKLSEVTGIPFTSIQQIVSSGIKLDLFIMGHSLGAPKAILTSTYLIKELDLDSADHQNIQLVVFTMGGPRVFDHTTAAAIDKLFGQRIIAFVASPFDIVPHLPFKCLGYKHVGQKVAVPITAHARNIGPINTLHKAYYGDKGATTLLAGKTIQNIISNYVSEDTDTCNSSLSTMSIMKLTGELITAWHSCNNYVSTIIRDNIYNKLYYGILEQPSPEPVPQKYPSGFSLAAIASYIGVHTYQLLQMSAPYITLFLLGQKQEQAAPAA